jgi:hypothetical protein
VLTPRLSSKTIKSAKKQQNKISTLKAVPKYYNGVVVISTFYFAHFSNTVFFLLASLLHSVSVIKFYVRWKCFIFRRVLRIARRSYWLRYVRLSVRMEHLGSHWTDFDESLYSSLFQKSLENIPFSLKSNKSNGYFHVDIFTFMTISCRIFLE